MASPSSLNYRPAAVLAAFSRFTERDLSDDTERHDGGFVPIRRTLRYIGKVIDARIGSASQSVAADLGAGPDLLLRRPPASKRWVARRADTTKDPTLGEATGSFCRRPAAIISHFTLLPLCRPESSALS